MFAAVPFSETRHEHDGACPWPVVKSCGGCCGHSPCDLEWYWPCAEQGGCIDRATCGGCQTPVTLKPPI